MLVSWCCKPSQPQRITSGLRETFIKRYTVERTNEAEIRPEEQSEKAESSRENLWNETQNKQNKNKTKQQQRKSVLPFKYDAQNTVEFSRHFKVTDRIADRKSLMS